MPLSTHRLMNALLPGFVRDAGRAAALRLIPSMRHLDMGLRLEALAAQGFAPQAVIDVGAARGEWSRLAHRLWPTARIVGFEPNATQTAALETLRREVPQFDFVRCFLGPEAKGGVRYRESGTQTSLLDPSSPTDAGAEAPMYALDDLVADGRVPQPQFIKLDVQGYELEALRGATATLANGVEGLLLEVSLARFFPGMPTADEAIAFCRERGFVLYDLLGVIRGARTDRLLQMDLLFLRDGHHLLTDRWE